MVGCVNWNRSLSLHFLLGRLQLLLFARLSVVLEDFADVNIVHLWKKLALRYVAGFAARTHMAEAASRIDAEGVPAI